MRTLHALLGNGQRLDGGAMFGNAPKALWARLIAPDDENRIPLACRSMVLVEPGRTVLFEAGIGDFFPPAMRARFAVDEGGNRLLEALAGLGIAPEDVDVVVLSHLHFDHAGGLLSGYREGRDPTLVFPRARFVTSRRAFERAVAPHVRDRASFIPELPGLLERSGRLLLVDGTSHPELPFARFHVSDGHTPGMLLAEVDGPRGPVVYGGDLIPGVPWVHLPLTMGYDRNPEGLIDEKRVLLEDLLARSGSLFFCHDPHVAMGTVHRDEKGRYGIVEPTGSTFSIPYAA